MKNTELIALPINTVVYNKETNEVLITASQLISTATENSILAALTLQGEHSNGIKVSDAKDWHTLDENAPAEVQLKVLQVRMSNLEAFVHTRLK